MNEKTGKQVAGFSSEALRKLMDYPWPGNVRELENAIEHAFVLCNRDKIEVDDFPIEIRQPNVLTDRYKGFTEKPYKREKLTREGLLDLLDECEWNKAEVGRRVGLSRTAIWKYMKKWKIPLQREE